MAKEISAEQAHFNSYTEKNWQIRVQQLAIINGWAWYHAPDNKPDKNGRVQNIVAGFPDLVLCKGNRLIFAELKKEGGRLSEWQKAWIERLELTDAEVYVWYPHDIKEVYAVLENKPLDTIKEI